MFKKLLAPIIVTGALLTGAQASASEVDFGELANKAQNNTVDINTKPLHQGAYDYNFTRNGINYHFYSDGVHFGYKWHDTRLESPYQDHLTPSQKIDKQQELFNQNQQYEQSKSNTEYTPVKEKVSNDYVAQRFEQNKQKEQPKTQQSTVKLSNGNTAGNVGTQAAQEMANRTGVPASTWEHIIAKESNGDPNAHNPSGADGLFQTMPLHGSTSSVQAQIDAAELAYNRQGLSAWGF